MLNFVIYCVFIWSIQKKFVPLQRFRFLRSHSVLELTSGLYLVDVLFGKFVNDKRLGKFKSQT